MNENKLSRIASRCSRYDNQYKNSVFQSSMAYLGNSCSKCSHFTKNCKCELGIADEILKNIDHCD